jgi:hypothetical protein
MKKSVLFVALAFAVIGNAWSAPQRESPPDMYGAIAAARENLATGYAVNQSTQQQAEQLALGECEKNADGKPCVVRVRLKNACGAVADASNGRAGYSWGQTQQRAEAEALKACEQVGHDCRVAISVCNRTIPATSDTLYQQ